MHGIRRTVDSVRCMIYGVRCTVYGVRCIVCRAAAVAESRRTSAHLSYGNNLTSLVRLLWLVYNIPSVNNIRIVNNQKNKKVLKDIRQY